MDFFQQRIMKPFFLDLQHGSVKQAELSEQACRSAGEPVFYAQERLVASLLRAEVSITGHPVQGKNRLKRMEGKIIDTRMSDLRIYEGKCPTLRAQRDGILYVKNKKIYQLTGYEALLLQGFP